MTEKTATNLPSEIQTFKPSSHHLKALVYWGAKRGKTTLAATSPNPLYLCSENGLLSIADKSPQYWIIRELEDLRKAYAYLKDNKTPFDTIVIDSLSEIAKVIKDNLTDRGKNKMTIQLRGNYSEEVMQTIRQIVLLDYHVVVIVHSKDVTDDSGNVVFYDIAIDGSAKNEIPRYFDTIAYCYIDKDGWYQVNIAGNNKTLCGDRSNKIPLVDTPLNIAEWIKAISTIAPKGKSAPVKQAQAPKIEEEKPADNTLNELNKLAGTEDIKDNTVKTFAALQAIPLAQLEQKSMDIKLQIGKVDLFSPEQKKAYNKFIDLAVKHLKK